MPGERPVLAGRQCAAKVYAPRGQRSQVEFRADLFKEGIGSRRKAFCPAGPDEPIAFAGWDVELLPQPIVSTFQGRRPRRKAVGAVGCIDYSGNMDTCIALRTLVVQGSRAYVQVGAGLVADSDPATEYQETLSKARGLLKAIEITERRREKLAI